MHTFSALLVLVGIALAVILLRELARYAVMLILNLARRVPVEVAGSEVWKRSKAFRFGLAERFPRLFKFVQTKTDPRQPRGLPLTLMLAVAFYVAALFTGLTEDILESNGVIQADNFVHKAFAGWRVEPLISVFHWITALGSSPSVVSAVIIATGFLWSQRRLYIIAPLWVTCLGAVASTSIGKLLIGRHRPPSELDFAAINSSFPSGHATASMAVYGFLAYAIARNLPSVRERFEIGYWTAILILLIGFSRIFLGVHYVTDVIGGFLVGGFWLLVGFTIAEWSGAKQFPVHQNLNGSIHQPRQSADEND